MQDINSAPRLEKKIATECISWRWHGNLGDDMIFAAQEAMFGHILDLGQYIPAPEAILVGGGTFVPKLPEHPDLLRLSARHPTAFFGTGIGDPLFWGRDYIPEWLEIIRHARFIGVRGPLSKERLESWGVPGDRIQWVGDPALYFARRNRSSYHESGEIAVNLGVTYGQLYGFDERQLEETVTRAIQQLVRIGWKVTLVCAWQPDDAVIERITTRTSVACIEHWHDNYGRALESIEKFDIVLSEKLHVAVAAACEGVPFVALCYRSKVLDFCRTIGWDEFCLSTEHLQPDHILELIAVLARARDKYSDRLQERVVKTRQRLLESVPLVIFALAGRPR